MSNGFATTVSIIIRCTFSIILNPSPENTRSSLYDAGLPGPSLEVDYEFAQAKKNHPDKKYSYLEVQAKCMPAPPITDESARGFSPTNAEIESRNG